LKRIFISNIVNKYCTIRHSIINRSQRMKTFLSSRIPYCQVYSPSVKVEFLLDKRRLYYTKTAVIKLWRHNTDTGYKLLIAVNYNQLHTCNVLTCLSLNLSSVYRSTSDVLPTHPSPNKTTLKLCEVVLRIAVELPDESPMSSPNGTFTFDRDDHAR